MAGVHSKTPEMLRGEAIQETRKKLADLKIMLKNLNAHSGDWVTAAMLGCEIEFPKYGIRDLLNNRINACKLTIKAYEREELRKRPDWLPAKQ